jgi:hypothetical protein
MDFFTDKYCKQCLKTVNCLKIHFKHVIVKRPEKYKNSKTEYLLHCPFGLFRLYLSTFQFLSASLNLIRNHTDLKLVRIFNEFNFTSAKNIYVIYRIGGPYREIFFEVLKTSFGLGPLYIRTDHTSK